jgi:hypothetical protein
MNSRNGGDPAEIERLAQQIIDHSVPRTGIESAKFFEGKYPVAQEEEIPEGYKKLVEEY